MALVVKNPPASARDMRDAVQSLGWVDSLEKEMATHSSILVWRIPRPMSDLILLTYPALGSTR